MRVKLLPVASPSSDCKLTGHKKLTKPSSNEYCQIQISRGTLSQIFRHFVIFVMFRRKLTALDYPPDLLNIQDETSYRNLIVFLEEKKIRHYGVEEREGLRDTESVEWPKVLEQYLVELGLSTELSKPETIDQLLATAIHFDYEDGDAEKYLEASAERIKSKKSSAPQIQAANPLDKLDFSSPEFVKGVNELAELLTVAKHPNHLQTLEACARLIKERYSKEAIKNGDNILKKGAAFPFQDVDKSFDSKDNVVNQAAKILRLLFIMDLRDLQTKINECIVSVQTITANPKTDTRLGKVGF